MNNRITYFDLAKGICIILVIIFHFQEQYRFYLPTDRYLEIIRIPLYYFLSGYFFKTYNGFIAFLRKKTDKLLIPFLFFYLTTSVILPIIFARIGGMHFETGSDWHNIYTFLTYNSFPNIPLWFLWALMIVNICFFLVYRFFKKSVILMGVLCLLLTICLGRYSFINLPASLNKAFDGLWFFFLGYYIHNSYETKTIPFLCITNTIQYFLLFIIYIVMGSIDSENYLLIILQRYVGGACGILFLLFICKKIDYIPYVSYVGRYSIILLVTHEPLMRALSSSHFPVCIILPTLFASYLIIIPLMIKYMPYVTAQKNFFSR